MVFFLLTLHYYLVAIDFSLHLGVPAKGNSIFYW